MRIKYFLALALIFPTLTQPNGASDAVNAAMGHISAHVKQDHVASAITYGGVAFALQHFRRTISSLPGVGLVAGVLGFEGEELVEALALYLGAQGVDAVLKTPYLAQALNLSLLQMAHTRLSGGKMDPHEIAARAVAGAILIHHGSPFVCGHIHDISHAWHQGASNGVDASAACANEACRAEG